MDRIGNFFSHLWRKYYPEFEVSQDEGMDKPVAKLAPESEVEPGHADLKEVDAKQVGVAIAEATYAVSGYTWYMILAVVWVAYFIYALDNQTAQSLAYTATSKLESDTTKASESYASAYTAQMLFVAISKLFIAKLADIFG